jgi:glyoxylase-like metal-dependent hydrolase (beta-lactamase superfamily II)
MTVSEDSALEELGGRRLAPGLWRWTAFHPSWREQVGAVAIAADDALVLIDPLATGLERDGDGGKDFWRALDRAVEQHARPVAVLLTVFWHRRSACEVVERYGAELWAAGGITGVDCEITNPFAPGDELPGGVVALATARGDEVVYWVPAARALVAGDVLLGGKRKPLRLCPQSWLPAGVDRRALARSLRPAVDLPVELLLVSHGQPLLAGAAEALATALDDAE